MTFVLSLLLVTAGSFAPGRCMMETRVSATGVDHVELLGPLDDTVVGLDGRYGVAVNLGNLDADPELEMVCRLSKRLENNLNITKLMVLDHDLTVVWSDTWGYTGNPEMPSVTLADIDGDGRDDIIVPMAETFFPQSPKYKCRIYALEGMTGAVKPGWPFILPGWPEDPYHNTHSEVVAADVDGDNTLEIIVQVEDLGSIRKPGAGLYVLNANGDSAWKYLFYDDTLDRHGAYTSPVVADLDGDGTLEIVCHVGWFQRAHPYLVIEKRMFIMNSDGTVRREWQTQGAVGGYSPDYASPAVADLDGDGEYEIVVARRSGYLDVYDTTGTMRTGFPVDLTADARYANTGHTKAFSTPALADLNGDGLMEIVVGTFGRESCNTRWAGRVHVFEPDGTPFHGFPVITRNGVWYSPAVGNLGGSASLEIATSGCDSAFYVFDANGDSMTGFPKRGFPTYWLPDRGSFIFFEGIIPMSKTPFLYDSDGDGLTEILMEGSDGTLHVWDTEAEYDTLALPCPTFRFNKERTGWYRSMVSGIGSGGGRVPAAGCWTCPDGNVVSGGRVRLVLRLAEPLTGPVVLLDQTGRVVRTVTRERLAAGTYELGVEIAGLAAGVYFVRAEGLDESARLVKIE